MSIRDSQNDGSDRDGDRNHGRDQEHPLFGDELDEWGRPRPTEEGRDFPPEHPAIGICHRRTAEGNLTAYHPDRLEMNKEAYITTDDSDDYHPIGDCK